MPAHENVLDDMESALRESIKKLGTDYVDLYLIHAPCALSPDWKTHQNVTVEQLWTSFEQLYNQKLTRSIGVSNFSVEQIERVMKIAKVPIHNQQVRQRNKDRYIDGQRDSRSEIQRDNETVSRRDR